MAADPMNHPWTLRVPVDLMTDLQNHLFPGDGDEHGAVIGASVVHTERGPRLLARRLYVARDGIDYVAGERGYRMLTAAFVRDRALDCADEQLAYLAVHCHRGTERVGFSPDDFRSHERGYPALLDVLGGPPVGAIVLAEEAAAGDIWLNDGSRVVLDHLEIVARPVQRLYSAPLPRPAAVDQKYDRQARIFGDRGQLLLSNQKVAVIGAGGGGSLVIEYLANLGVGHLLAIDPERIDPTNAPRLVSSRRRDLHPLLTGRLSPRWLQARGERRRTHKVRIAERNARQVQPGITFESIVGDVTDAGVVERLLDCDYIFLAADSAQARLVFNALVHQYLIPGVQIGAKVQIDKTSGDVIDVFSVSRPIIPGHGCLWCNGLVSPAKLQDEATTAEQRRKQRYVHEEDLPSPSVITLNAVAAAAAANDYLMTMTGLLANEPLAWTKHHAMTLETINELPRRDSTCSECSSQGRLAAGAARPLPVRQRDSS